MKKDSVSDGFEKAFSEMTGATFVDVTPPNSENIKIMGMEVFCSECFAHFSKEYDHQCPPWLVIAVDNLKKNKPHIYNRIMQNNIHLKK